MPEGNDPKQTPPVQTPGALANALVELTKRQLESDTPLEEKKKRLEEAKAEFEQSYKLKLSELLTPAVIKYGELTAGRRIPAKRSGSLEAGQIRGLQWENFSDDPTRVPEKLRSKLAPEAAGFEKSRLSFIPGADLWHVWFPQGNQNPSFDADAFVVLPGEGDPCFLNWESAPIHKLNRDQKFRYSADLYAYVRFFFYLLRGDSRYPFTLIEDKEDLDNRVPWDERSADWNGKKEEALHQVKRLSRTSVNANGDTRFKATVFYQNAIFRCIIAVSAVGYVTMEHDDVKMSDLPVLSNEMDVINQPEG